MKELVVLSGKGGTGKTTLAASFAALGQGQVLADCDVDAPDLWLVLQPKIQRKGDFVGARVAQIDPERCQQCGNCQEVCHFEAVTELFTIDPLACEGCGTCALACPVEAITLLEVLTGRWFVGETPYGPMVYARLGAGQENSGKLVTLVRQQAREVAQEKGLDFVLIDGPPGIGCPVIASVSGVNAALVVTEPTLSGQHDLERVVAVCHHFGVHPLICVNKFDLNPTVTEEITVYCRKNGLEMVGQVPFDPTAVEAVVKAVPLVEYDRGEAASAIVALWERIKEIL
ncbi:MAG TPA: (4Fe-4S)-binding protein [Armatimonadetes bacterium]|nr:(4Fe-4S)-binding protein [Armatimonadota bacterium]